MRLSLCSPPAGPLERAPLTALWASVAPATGAAAAPAAADAAPVSTAAAECDGWWTAEPRPRTTGAPAGAGSWG